MSRGLPTRAARAQALQNLGLEANDAQGNEINELNDAVNFENHSVNNEGENASVHSTHSVQSMHTDESENSIHSNGSVRGRRAHEQGIRHLEDYTQSPFHNIPDGERSNPDLDQSS